MFLVGRKKSIHHPKAAPAGERAGFSRFDLLVTVTILGVIGGILYAFVFNTNTKRNLEVCREHQLTIGVGFADFIADNDNRLPYAHISTNAIRATWDFALRHYLSGGVLTTNTLFSIEARSRGQELAKVFRCPSDTIRRNQSTRARSYAMPRHQPSRKYWPPNKDCETGVGLYLMARFDEDNRLKLPPWRLETETNRLTFISTSMITDPGDTLMVAEKADAKNLLYGGGAFIKTTAEHLDTNLLSLASYHSGKLNYLMVDGHVEALSPEQTVGWKGKVGNDPGTHKGIWTIKAGD